MKKVLLALLSIYTLTSCAQKKQKPEKQKPEKQIEESIMIPYPKEFKDITAENYVENILLRVKKHEKHIKYFIRPTQTNCIFEVLVNDIPIHNEYTLEKTASPVSINSEILKSGLQTITVRMYPIGDAIKDAYGKGETITTLQRNSNVSIKVVKYEAFNISDELDDEIIVMQHESPVNKKTDNFMGDGLPFYEYTFTFNANVPYDLGGYYDQGEDLTKFDEGELQDATLKYYNNLKKVFKDNDEDMFAKVNFADDLRISESCYKDEQYLKKGWDWFKNVIKISDKDFFDIEKGTELQFFGNGKVVALRHPTINPIDKRLRGKSAFGFLHKEDGRRKAKFIGLFLYLPKGASLDKLQMMR